MLVRPIREQLVRERVVKPGCPLGCLDRTGDQRGADHALPERFFLS